MGKFFTHLSEMLKILMIEKTAHYSIFKKIIRRFLYPILDLITKFDNSNFVKNNPKMNGFHNGYFIIARKIK